MTWGPLISILGCTWLLNLGSEISWFVNVNTVGLQADVRLHMFRAIYRLPYVVYYHSYRHLLSPILWKIHHTKSIRHLHRDCYWHCFKFKLAATSTWLICETYEIIIGTRQFRRKCPGFFFLMLLTGYLGANELYRTTISRCNIYTSMHFCKSTTRLWSQELDE